MNIAYLLETTDLCGGVKVVFRQAEALLKRGIAAVIISADNYPGWFEGRVPFLQQDPFDAARLKAYDRIVGTTYRLVNAIYQDRELRSRLWHLSQGYEGDYVEQHDNIPLIEAAYALSVPKLTISEQMATRLKARFHGSPVFSVGQGIETEYFHLANPSTDASSPRLEEVVLVGAFNNSVKQIHLGLKAFLKANHRLSHLKLVRISPVDTRQKEENLVGPIDTYYRQLTPRQVGNVLRAANGVLLSPSSAGEGFGLPPIEAMACGVPTVLSDIPSYGGYAAPRDYALFAPCDDFHAMADAICRLAANPSLRKRLAQRGLQVADRFSFDTVAAAIEKVLQNECST